jgi:hypothetical protein
VGRARQTRTPTCETPTAYPSATCLRWTLSNRSSCHWEMSDEDGALACAPEKHRLRTSAGTKPESRCSTSISSSTCSVSTNLGTGSERIAEYRPMLNPLVMSSANPPTRRSDLAATRKRERPGVDVSASGEGAAVHESTQSWDGRRDRESACRRGDTCASSSTRGDRDQRSNRSRSPT